MFASFILSLLTNGLHPAPGKLCHQSHSSLWCWEGSLAGRAEKCGCWSCNDRRRQDICHLEPRGQSPPGWGSLLLSRQLQSVPPVVVTRTWLGWDPRGDNSYGRGGHVESQQGAERDSPDRDAEREDIMLDIRRLVPRNVRTPRVERITIGTDSNMLAWWVRDNWLLCNLDQVSYIDI